MRLAFPIFVALSFSHCVAAQASTPSIPLEICANEAAHIQPKFEKLLDAASIRDYSAFFEAAGGRGIGAAKFLDIDDGRQDLEAVFAVWADLVNPEAQDVALQIWRPVFDEKADGQRPFRAFFVRIERSEWSVSKSTSDRVREDYLVYSYGCDLFLIQETDFPYLP